MASAKITVEKSLGAFDAPPSSAKNQRLLSLLRSWIGQDPAGQKKALKKLMAGLERHPLSFRRGA